VRHIILSIFALVSILFVVSEVQAQEGPTWKKVCVDTKKPETCRIAQQRFLTKVVDGKEQVVGRVLGLTIVYSTDATTKKRAPYMSIQMPLGVDLRPGALLQVDAGAEIPVPFLQCTNAGCDASLVLDAKLLKELKAGNTLKVGFRPWGTQKLTAVDASLKGLTKALKDIK